MLDFLTKKKIKESKIAELFVNTTLRITEENFEEVAELIGYIPEFSKPPVVEKSKPNAFVLIVIVTNLDRLDDFFEARQSDRIRTMIVQKFALVYGLKSAEFEVIIKDYKQFLSRVNHPSKNKIYAMSKGMFHKYNLNEYQSSYFKSMNTPNPLFLKKMDEVMEQFLWNWNTLIENYKIVSQ